MTRFNADDYGVCPAQCEAIRACRREGALTGVSVMPNSPYLAQAMAALAGDAALEVAVHLNVTEGLCLSKPEEVPRLAGADGRFRQTFFRLFIQGCLPGRKALKAQLKKELRAQLRRVWPLLDGRALRLDGHQHIQMAPIVLAALAEALAEEGLRPAYLRCSCEPLGPYLRKMSLWRDYRPVNIVKNLVLNLCGRLGRRRLRAMGLAPGMVMGVVLSGNMEYRLVKALLPDFEKTAARRGRELELVMHPGWGIGPGESLDVPGGPFEAFNTDGGRRREYDCLLRLKQ